MAEAGIEIEARKDVNSRVKSDVLHDRTTEVVPHFVPSGAVSDPFKALSNDQMRAVLLILVSKLTDRHVNELIPIVEMMQRQQSTPDALCRAVHGTHV